MASRSCSINRCRAYLLRGSRSPFTLSVPTLREDMGKGHREWEMEATGSEGGRQCRPVLYNTWRPFAELDK